MPACCISQQCSPNVCMNNEQGNAFGYLARERHGIKRSTLLAYSRNKTGCKLHASGLGCTATAGSRTNTCTLIIDAFTVQYALNANRRSSGHQRQWIINPSLQICNFNVHAGKSSRIHCLFLRPCASVCVIQRFSKQVSAEKRTRGKVSADKSYTYKRDDTTTKIIRNAVTVTNGPYPLFLEYNAVDSIITLLAVLI